MKIVTAATVPLVLCITGCASIDRPPTGLLWTETKGPVATASGGIGYSPTPHEGPPVFNLFGLIAHGDGSIATARENAPRQGSLSHVDYQQGTVLGLTEFKTMTYGISP